MNNKYVFISDFFVEDVVGGAELNDEELIKLLQIKGNDVLKKRSHEIKVPFVAEHCDFRFIVSNFTNLSLSVLEFLTKNCDYIIYEHDHKYLPGRNPANYSDFKAPSEQIINLDFYKNAKSVFCQSRFHSEIVHLNTKLENIQVISGNLWSEKTLDLLEDMTSVEKDDCAAIMGSQIHNKKTEVAIKYCIHKKIKYRLIASRDNEEFLRRLGANRMLVFFPSTPETLSRLVCEARMMGMKVVVNDLVGATKEDWFNLKGKLLVDHMRQKRNEIVELVESSF